MKYVGLEPAAFLTDPSFGCMSTEERGAYISLLLWLYSEGGEININGNGVAIAGLIGSCGDPEKLWSKIKHMFEVDGTTIRHTRVSLEIAKAQNRRKQASEAGKRGADKRWGAPKAPHRGRHGDLMPKSKSKGKGKEKDTKKKIKHLDCVLLTSEEFNKLVAKFGDADTTQRIERLNNYIASTGKRYQSHYHTILCWAARDAKDTGKKTKQLPDIFGKVCSIDSCGMPARLRVPGSYGDSFYCIEHISPKRLEKLREQGYDV